MTGSGATNSKLFTVVSILLVWKGVLDRIVKTMTERQALSVAAGLLDEYEDTVSVMVSENVLDRDGQRISFFHESFFDYIFARRMISSPDFDLVSYILEQGQSLFIRSQVRQVLLHLRDISTQDCSRRPGSCANEYGDSAAHQGHRVVTIRYVRQPCRRGVGRC